MPTTTANLGLTLPTPNVDTGWGGTLNSDFTIIDNLFAAAGTGPSVGINVGTGKTANIGGTLLTTGTILLGSGDGTSTTATPVIRGPARTGTNAVGAGLIIQAANGTGDAGSGTIVFQTAAPGASGTTPGTLANKMVVGRDYVYADNATAASYDNSTKLATTAQVYSTVTTVPINYQNTTAYTLQLSDVGKMVHLDAGTAITLTVPNGVFSAGHRIEITQLAGGQVTVVPGLGVSVFSVGSLTNLKAQFSAATIHFWDANRFQLIGDLA